MLRDREEAGRLLALRLAAYRDDVHGLILALPRGGVAVGYELSVGLHLPLDVFLVRKLGAPGNPEYAVGAVTETGSLYFNHETMRALSLSSSDLAPTIRVQQDEILRQQALYRTERPLPTLTDQTVLLVDDGVATGVTFFASIQALRRLPVNRLIAAIPVGPPEILREIGTLVDELVALQAPEPFFAVGNHYMDFRPVEDEAVLRCLNEAN